ncbi:unnamed protein product [Periconia digitata]|uniref:Uncharacterized protein n=1 Tax=Periconia digitata TaxID=1303443 RepID=A0A9W4U2N6_9PLEO|nr:unnamed protein product [Periconia digitata]
MMPAENCPAPMACQGSGLSSRQPACLLHPRVIAVVSCSPAWCVAQVAELPLALLCLPACPDRTNSLQMSECYRDGVNTVHVLYACTWYYTVTLYHCFGSLSLGRLQSPNLPKHAF